MPHASFTSWEPPTENDDDRPILAAAAADAAPTEIRMAVPPEIGAAALELDNAPTALTEPDDDPREFARIFVNVGRRDGANAAAFHRLLVDEGGLARTDTGRIYVRDRISFVSVRRELSEKAIALLTGQVLGGRTIVAEPARDPN